MSTPRIAARNPVEVELESGRDYFFCACGESASQPFCDGSHRGTGIAPVKFTPETSGPAFLCQCKHTGNTPFCDGTHASI